jgi:hypothetical protein
MCPQKIAICENNDFSLSRFDCYLAAAVTAGRVISGALPQPASAAAPINPIAWTRLLK